MEERLTLTQVLEITTEMLEGIDVPMKLIDTIGIPVAKAIKNLKLCIDAQKEAEKEASAKAEAEKPVPEEMGEIDFGEESEGEDESDT